MGNTQANEKQTKSGKSPQAKSKNFIRNYRKSPGRESKKHGKKKGEQKREAIDREFDKTPDSDNVDVIEASDNDTVEWPTTAEGSARSESEVTVSRCGRSVTCRAPAPPHASASPGDPSSSESVWTDPLTPLAAVELNHAYYSAESDSALEERPAPRTLTPSPARSDITVDMPHDDAASALSHDDTEKEEKNDVFDDNNDREENVVMGGLISGARSDSAKRSASHECNHDFLDNRLKASPAQTSFTVSKHRRVELPPVELPQVARETSLALLDTSSSCESDRRHSSVSDVLMSESNVLRKVASLTLDKHSETRIVRPKYVPDKLDFRLYEKFEGQMLLNWFVSSVSENSHLKSLVSAQDLKNVGIQYCTHLLAAGVLRQISDKDAPTENIFKPSLMYYWAHMETPASQPVTPGRLPSSWPPDRDQPYASTDTSCTLDNNKFFSQNNNEEISDIIQAKTLISQLKRKLQELEYQLEKYKINSQIEALNKCLEKDYNELNTLRYKTQSTSITSKDLQASNELSETNKLENKPVINIPEYAPVRTNVNNHKKIDLSSLDSKNEMISKDITSTPQVRSDKIENYCKLNKSREYNTSFRKTKDTLQDEKQRDESRAKVDDSVNDNISSEVSLKCDTSSDASFRSIICTSTDLMCDVENLRYVANDDSKFRNTSIHSPTTQVLYTNTEYKDPVSYDGHNIISLEHDSLIFIESEVKKQGIDKASPEDVSVATMTSVTGRPVSDKSSLVEMPVLSSETNAASQVVVTPPPPSPGMPPMPPPMPGTMDREYEKTERVHSPEFKVPFPPKASSPPLRDRRTPSPQLGLPPPPMPPMGLTVPMSKMEPPPMPEIDPPTPTNLGMVPPPPPIPGLEPPPHPMPGMGPPPPPMPEMGPPPPPMPGMGPPPPPMPGMGPPPPPMPGMGPPPPPMPGMGPAPPPMLGMGPAPPPMPGMGPAPPPMPGMGPPPPPMPGMGPPPPLMPGMGPPPPPMSGMSPAPPPMPGMSPAPPPMPGMPLSMTGMGPPPPPGLGPMPPPPPSSTYSGPVPFPAPPAGGWNVQRATLRKTPVKPAAPMKPLYWTRILAAPTPPVCHGESDASGVKPLWLEIEETKLDNIDEFTDLFSRQIVKAPVKKKVEVKTKIQPVKILDSKRSQNVGILAQSLHVEFSEIENAIYNFDTSVVSLEALQQIYELRANDEELALIKEHLQKKPEIPLDKPEAFLHDLSGIPNFAERISCFMFQAEFEDSVSTTMHKLDNLKHTCEFLLTSEPLKKLFAIILTLGNYMNGGNGQRGQADGFGLEILSKLKDVKSKQSNVTLLHFIVRTYMRSCGGALSEACVLPVPEPGDVVRASTLDFADVAAHLAALTNQLAACKEKTRKVLENDEARSPCDDALHADTRKRLEVFHDKMTTYLQAAEEKLKTENENLEECRIKFIATVKFYQYTPKGSKLEDCEPKEFFSLWTSFCSDFKDIYKKEEQLAVKEKIKEAKKLQEERKSQSLTQPKKEGGLKARLQKLSSSRK